MKKNGVAKDISDIRQMLERVPSHFDMRHVVAAFFGALFFGFTFVMKGLLLQVGLSLSSWNLFLITFATVFIVTAEIYFIGYSRVKNKSARHFGQFWAKRIVSYYGISLFVAFMLLYVYGLLDGLYFYEVSRLVVAVSFPAAIGAASADLLNQY